MRLNKLLILLTVAISSCFPSVNGSVLGDDLDSNLPVEGIVHTNSRPNARQRKAVNSRNFEIERLKKNS